MNKCYVDPCSLTIGILDRQCWDFESNSSKESIQRNTVNEEYKKNICLPLRLSRIYVTFVIFLENFI